MNPDELFDLLDLSAPLAAVPDVDLEHADGEVPTDRHETLVQCDEWALRRGRDLAACPRWEATGENEHAAADCHAVTFDPCPEVQPCVDRQREKFLTTLLETPEFQALRSETILDDLASQIAALHVGDQLAEFRRKTGEGEMPDEIAALGAAGKAIAAATEEVKELREAEGALGMGPGAGGGPRDPKAAAEAFKRVRNNPALRKICELAGRFRRVAQSKQRIKTVHGQDDMIGVELGGDLSRIVPVELGRLDAGEELELDTLRRIVERQVMNREYAGSEPMGKGPIIVTLDESGSMSSKIDAAKGLALALAWIARQQKRWCAIVAYSGGSGERIIALPPGKWDDVALFEWLCGFIGNGSNIDVPIAELPRMYADLNPPVGKTDVVMVTDAICSLPPEMVRRFNVWRTAVKARVVSLIMSSAAGDLARVSDECHLIGTLEADGEAVGKVLSL